MGQTVSLAMIACNEQFNIARCLQSVRGVVDEIIVVDTGSTDQTVAIARDFGAKIYEFAWNDDFSAARNQALEHASCDWILCLDADEELLGDSCEVLRQLIQNLDMEGYFCKIVNYMGGMERLAPCADLVFRLFRNKPNYRFHYAVHEQIVDVIMAHDSQVKCQTCEQLVILHYGYLDQQIIDKDKRQRNLLMIKRELESHPEDRWVHYHYGVELFRSGRLQEAAEELSQVVRNIDTQPVYLPKLLRYLVLCYQGLGDYDQALTVVDQALRFFPNYADLYYCAGLIYYDRRDYSRAVHHLLKACSTGTQPAYYASFSGVQRFRTYYYLGLLSEVFDNAEEAVRYYMLSVQDNPRFTASLERFTYLLQPWQDIDDARYALNKVFDFSNSEASLLIAGILFAQHAFTLALEYLDQRFQQVTGTPEQLLWKAVCLLQQRRFAEAETLLDELSANPAIVWQVRLNQLYSLCLQRRCDEARVSGVEMLQMTIPEEAVAVTRLLSGLVGQTKISVSRDGFVLLKDIVARMLDVNEAELTAQLLHNVATESVAVQALDLGLIFKRAGYFLQAEEYLKLCLEHDWNWAALMALADIQQQRGDVVMAERNYREALALNPCHPRPYLRLIELYDRCHTEFVRQGSLLFPDLPQFSIRKD